MSKKEIAKEIVMSYFIVVTLINIAMAVLGLLLDNNKTFGYEAFFSPMIYGFLGIIPSLISYSKKELSIKKVIVRKILQFIFLEFVILSFISLNGVSDLGILIPTGIAVFLISVFAEIFLWYLNYEKARSLNQLLKLYQEK